MAIVAPLRLINCALPLPKSIDTAALPKLVFVLPLMRNFGFPMPALICPVNPVHVPAIVQSCDDVALMVTT